MRSVDGPHQGAPAAPRAGADQAERAGSRFRAISALHHRHRRRAGAPWHGRAPPDPTDRRAKLVAITDAGEAGLDVANATRERLLKEIFGALSEADRATFLRLLDGLDEAARRLISASATDVPAVSA